MASGAGSLAPAPAPSVRRGGGGGQTGPVGSEELGAWHLSQPHTPAPTVGRTGHCGHWPLWTHHLKPEPEPELIMNHWSQSELDRSAASTSDKGCQLSCE